MKKSNLFLWDNVFVTRVVYDLAYTYFFTFVLIRILCIFWVELTFIFKKYLPTRKLESQLMSTAIDMAAGRGP